MDDILNGISSPDIAIFGLNSVFKLLFFVIIIGYVLYSLLLTLRMRILADTVSTPFNNTVRMLGYFHLFFVIFGSFIAMILILLG